MATITVEIANETLAREVLAHMGYLPDDEIPDLVSDEEETDEEDEEDASDEEISNIEGTIKYFTEDEQILNYLRAVYLNDDKIQRRSAAKAVMIKLAKEKKDWVPRYPADVQAEIVA
jgi:hypothetical protein